MRTLPNAAAAAGAVLCAGTALAGMQGIDYNIVGTNLVDTGGDFNWTVDVLAILDAGDRLDAVAGNQTTQKLISTNGSFYQNSFCGGTSMENNEGFWPMQPSMEFDSYVTIGLRSSAGNSLQTIGIDFAPFEAGGDLSTNNGTWFVIPTDPQGNPVSEATKDCATMDAVVIARLTVVGDNSVNVAALFQGRDASNVTWQHTEDVFITYDEVMDGDCDGNGLADRCDFAAGGDSDNNGVLDACEFIDCNENGVNDPDDIANGTSDDCDGNGIPDECDLADGAADCNGDGLMDACDMGEDCNGNGTPDACDINSGDAEDCDGNGRPDSCDIADGGDANGNGELDACEVTPYLNLNSGLISDTAASAVFAADNGDTIEAEADFFNAEDDVNMMGKNLYMNVVEGSMNQGGTITLANGAVVSGFGGSAVNNVTSGFGGTGVIADDTSVSASGMTLVRGGSGVEFDSPATHMSGDALVLSGGSMLASGNLSNTGSMTTVGSSVVAAAAMDNAGYMSTSGTFVTDLGNSVDGEVYCNDETMLSGSLVNDGLVSVNRGPLYILGDLTNNGTIVGEVDTGPGSRGMGEPIEGDGLRIGGNYTAGADAELLMPHANWRLSVGGNVALAINDNDRFVMDEATLAMTGVSSTQTLEAMSTDVDSHPDGLDRTMEGHFPLGVLVIESGSDVTVVDNHVNHEGDETIYVRHLVIEAGAIFRTGDRTVWYETVELFGTVDGEIDVITEPCPGNADGNGLVDIDDLLIVIGNFECEGACDGDIDGNNLVDIDDLLIVISHFGESCP